jgi:hypothetical protein
VDLEGRGRRQLRVVLLMLVVQHLLHGLDVLDGVAQRVHLRHLLGLGGGRDVAAEHLEAAVDLGSI